MIMLRVMSATIIVAARNVVAAVPHRALHYMADYIGTTLQSGGRQSDRSAQQTEQVQVRPGVTVAVVVVAVGEMIVSMHFYYPPLLMEEGDDFLIAWWLSGWRR
jgi:hypothetical protein